MKKVFLFEERICGGKQVTARGTKKRIEYYAGKSWLWVPSHHLKHSMTTQLLNAAAELAITQGLLGHNWITTRLQQLKVFFSLYILLNVMISMGDDGEIF